MTSLTVSLFDTHALNIFDADDFREDEQYLKDHANVVVHDTRFTKATGSQIQLTLLLSSLDSTKNPFFGPGCSYNTRTGEMYTTSGLLAPSSSSKFPVVLISRIKVFSKSNTPLSSENPELGYLTWSKLRPPANMAMPSGCTAFRDGVLYCDQGNIRADTSGIVYMPSGQPPQTQVSLYMGRPFNSPQGLAVSMQSNSIWFTDTTDGVLDDFRPRAKLPCCVYRLDLKTMQVRAMADGFDRPTGVAVSPDGQTVYVAEAGIREPSKYDVQPTLSSIFAFDVIERDSGVFLANRRLLGYPLSDRLLTIQCDAQGYIYAACSDGLEVWHPNGDFLGAIRIPGGASSFAFGNARDIFVCGQQRLWRVQFD